MRKYLHPVLFVLCLLISPCFVAQKLYWVGGSGNFNDAAHWSLSSGGVGGAKSPTITDDVYFDKNSFAGESVISFIGNSVAHDFTFAQYTPKVIFEGMQHEKISLSGKLQLNQYIDNRFVGDMWFTSNEASTPVVFALTKLKGNVYFDGNTQWELHGDITTGDNATVYFKQGVFNLSRAAIYSGNLIASPGVTINTNQTTFRIANKFVLPAGVIFNDTQCRIRAYTKDPLKWQVANTINFNTNSRLNNLNNVMTACNITINQIVQPTCSGFCNGMIVFNIPSPKCSGSDSIVCSWGNAFGCTFLPDTVFTGNSPITYSVSGLCSSINQYKATFVNPDDVNDSIYNSPAGIGMANPPPPQIQGFSLVKPTCFGLCNGSVIMTLVVGDGTAPLKSTWTTPAGGTVIHSGLNNITAHNKDTLKNACAGTYSVFLTDANGCTSATSTVTLGQPTKVVSVPTFTNPLCSGVCDGIIQDNPSGGTGAYTCSLDSAGGAGSNLAMPGCSVSGLCAGTYTVFAKDAHGCQDTNIVTITPPPVITFVKSPASGTLNIPCQSACSGSVSVTNVAGGVAPYTFSWTPATGAVSSTANSSTYSNLCGSVAGVTYTCTITDANGCVKTATFMVKSPPALTLTTTFTNPKCNSASTGSATATASGGTAGYTFTWSPGGGTQGGVSPLSTYSNIPAGTYTVYDTDANLCKDSAVVTLVNPPVLTGTMTTIVNPTCPNLNNGHMCVTAGGGTGPYTYTWSPNPPATGTGTCTPNTLTVTPGGTSVYNVTITDAHACTITVSGTLVSPPVVTVTTAVTSPPCSGACNGSATLTPTGGTGPFNYNYSCSGSTIDVISGQCGGTTCNYTVTDANSCKTNGSVSFILPTPLTLSLTPTSLLCAGNCNGQINSAAGGGTGTYTYTWAGPGVCVACQNQTNLCTGNYTCTIVDGNGCTLTATTSIASPPPISMTLTPTNPTCSGLCNGSILGTISGGTAPLTHTWTSSVGGIGANPPNTLNPNNLCAGTYSLEVTDANGCIDSDTTTLISPLPVTFVLITTSITCSGQCNGTASVTPTPTGGTPGYQYSWNGGAFGPITFTNNLCANTYSVEVEDSHGCLATPQFFTINSPAPLIVAVKNIINTCNGLCNGGATANVSGGTPAYQFGWDGGAFSPSDSVISNLCVGTHTLFVKDANGCLGSVTFNIVPLVNISISVSSNTVSCHNSCDAIGTAQASGSSSPPYTIQWVNPAITCTVPASSPCIASGLCSGTQTIIATDALGCSSTTTISIVNPPALAATATATPVACFGLCTGSATVTPSGGTPNGSNPFYNISWDSPLSSTVTTVSNLCPGTYTANISDHNGCAITQTVNIAVSGQFVVTNTLTSPSTCGASDGSISITVSGGSGTYTVNWASGGTSTSSSPTFTYSNIPAGSYTATITDSHGCDTTIVYGLNSPTGPVLNYTVTNATCFGLCNGSATVIATGANPTFTVTWPGGVPTGTNSITATSLCGNPSTNYLVQATDAIGCITFTTVTVTSPTQIQVVATSTNPTCGGSNGVISLAASGGFGSGYSYSWNGGVSSFTNNPETGLAAGVDTVVITDGAGCTQQYTFTLTSVSSPSVTVNTGSVTCSYLSNGTATATVIGGSSPFSYTWINSSGATVASGANIASVTNLPCGNYSLSVVDANSCSAQTTFTVVCPTPINPHFVKQDVLCNLGSTGTASVNPTGGAPAYTYTWSTGPTTQSVTTLAQGNYNVIVEDANSCTDTVKFTINQPNALSMTVTSTPPTCFGGTNGTATVTVSGGTPFAGPVYTYTWSNATNTATTSNLSVSGSPYIITVGDSNLCTLSQVLTFTNQPSQISPTVTATNPTCGGNCNGSIVTNVSGGTGTYTFAWSPLGGSGIVNSTTTSSTYSNLCVDSYNLVVTDANSCSVTISPITISAPVAPTLTYTTSPATCSLSPCNGSITITATSASVTVNWLNTSCGSSLNCNTLCAGTYSVQLTDASLCVDTVVIPLSNSTGPVIASSFTNVTCNGSSNGAAFDTVLSGNAPYIFSWTPSATTTSTTTSSLNSGLAAGNYFSTITDANGCITVTNFTITQPTSIQDNPTVKSATCFGINNGTIISSGSGGTPFAAGYLYQIDGSGFSSTPSTSFTFTPLSAGSHTVCIMDSLNCSKCFTYSITPSVLIVSSISATNATCFGTCNGSATVSSIGGGTSPYVVTWSDPNNQVGTTASNLCAGTYTALITDNVGCQANDTITITSPNTINPNSVITPPSCGQCNGVIMVTPSGGNGGAYTFTWTPSGNTNTINNVCAGVYQVGISDNLACEQTFIIPVSSLNSPTITPTVTNVTCSNLCNGSITTSITGGAIPYTYFWPIGTQTTSAINNQCPGNYIVEVKDSLGCIATQSVTIDSGIKIKPNITIIAPSCGVCNGTINTNVTGGSGTYTYSWSPNASPSTTTPTITPVCAGLYTLVVTDATSGCAVTDTIALNSSSGPSLSIMATEVTCNGLCNGSATLTATGGTTPYNVTWNTTPPQNTLIATNLCGGSTYIVQVTDAAFCVQNEQITITQPTKLDTGLSTITTIQCFNNTNGAINTVIVGGTPSYIYSWTPATITGSGGTNLSPGTYSAIVTDANGCTINVSNTLTNPPLLSISGTFTNATCNNVPDGAITTITSGGTPTYTYQWSGGSSVTTPNLSAILPGNYSVTVTDSKGCLATNSFTVISTVTITVNAGKDTTLCTNASVVLSGTVTGAPTFDWQTITGTVIPPINTLTVSVNPTTTTQYVLLAVNGACRDSDTVTVFIASLPVANAGPNQSIFLGQTATIGGNPSNPSGGTMVWYPNSTLSDSAIGNPISSPTITTTYTLVVTNSVGCKATDTIVVTVLPPFTIPTGFTPNGDGKNDSWMLDGINQFPNVEIEVYNRWGEQLFYSKGNYTPWMGTYNGKNVPVGTYYYIIRLNDPRYPDHYAGPLTILR